jgi:hypothetical protein
MSNAERTVLERECPFFGGSEVGIQLILPSKVMANTFPERQLFGDESDKR